eukprot:CAMPEP_0176414020 /NCGR_PEP_ID=MMETSP0127-20121128/5021_1 /TAXON_ID=938130 /ORGANISM="Platyophrya macrostoma, Strain WH" /LENGTH=291 /DNA_ID=CAMNT_0017793863 /DNA_START=26 /DNA_END=901 /DNA_ORIENTATION=-
MSKPEDQAPPEFYFNVEEAKKYTVNTRILKIQTEMTERALEMLNLAPDSPALILDIGCGSGISGSVATSEGHTWIGLDISRAMLERALESEVQGELYQCDVGEGFNFRPGVFDGAISISAIQWLFVAARKDQIPQKRINKFFSSLNQCLGKNARAVFQFYPNGSEQIEMLTTAALKAGFKAALIVDYPDVKRKQKIYLVCASAEDDLTSLKPKKGIETMDSDDSEMEESKEDKIEFMSKKSKYIHKGHKKNEKAKFKSKEWIIKKKSRQRGQGKQVRHDSKYTGRKRKHAI